MKKFFLTIVRPCLFGSFVACCIIALFSPPNAYAYKTTAGLELLAIIAINTAPESHQ